jgi:hypothetical protein
MPTVAKSASRSPKKTSAPARVLYLYAISRMPPRREPAIAAEGIDGLSPVEAVRCKDYLCWISRVSKTDFADHITQHMQDLEWLAAAGLRHQRVVSEISAKLAALPARFATVFLTDASLAKHIEEREHALQAAFARVADADEWGIKIFSIAKPKARAATTPSSGADYLKQKAQLLQPRASKKLDKDVEEFVSVLKHLSVAGSPGGKASAGQPGLLWHGSFLVARKDRKKLDAALKKYAAQWREVRRVDCTGPWPPYSFVGDHV